MEDKIIENNSLPQLSYDSPKEATEINYGPDMITQPDFPKADWDPNRYTFDRLENTALPAISTNNTDPFKNVSNSFADRFYKRAQKMDYEKMGAPTPFNAESTLFEKFKSSYDFADKGFIPWRDNDEIYNQDTNLLKELYRSTKWAAPLFLEGAVSGLRTFPDLVQGAYNFDWDQIIKSDDQLAEKWSRANDMGVSTAGGISSFLTGFEISAANMVGMIAETFAEDALIGYITAQSGGTTAPLLVAEAGKTASLFSNIYKGLKNINKIGDIFKEANNARRFYEITGNGLKAFGKGTLEFLNPLQQTTRFIGDLRKGEDYIKNASTAGKALQGFGSFYRDLREINFALTEAKLEGGFSRLERSNEMTNKFISENGYAPQGKDAQEIEKNARKGGDFTTQLNLPVIYFSNRIGFGNLFKGFTPLNKLMAEAATGQSIFKNISFNSVKKLFEESSKFSLKKSFRSGLGNSLNYFKANYMEGIQENLQDVIQGAATDYYDKQFKNKSYGGYMIMLGDIGNQFGKKVFTGQGAETFASGALMGLVVQGGMKGISGVQNLTYKLTQPEQYKEFKEKRTEQIKKYVDQLNEIYKDPTKYLDPQLMNAVRQGELSKYLSQSLKNENKKEFYDIKDQAVYEHLVTMVRSGKTDIFKDRLEEMKQLTPDEFEEALGFKVENQTEFKGYIDDQIKKVDRIQSLYDKANEKLKNPVNLSAYKKDSKEYNTAAQQYLAFENAKQQAIFANYSFMRNTERMSDLLTQMTKTKIMEKASYTDFSKITDPVLLNKEMSILKDEIDSLTQGGDKASLEIAKSKIKKLKALEVWKGVMDSPQLEKNPEVALEKQRLLLESGAPTKPIFPIDYPSINNPAYENWRSAAKLAFEKLVEVEADANKEFVYRDGINNVFDLIMDYHTLGRESKGMMEMVNILADPDNFLKLYEGHFAVIRNLQEKRLNVLITAIKNALVVNDDNKLINLLALNDYVEDPENPGTYFKISDLSSIEPDSEDAKKIDEIIKNYKEATNLDEEEETPEETSTPVSIEDAIEKERQEKLKPYDERDAKSLEVIMPNNPNHPTFKVGMKYNAGMNVIVEKSDADSWDGKGEGYTVITAVISPAEFDENGKMTKAAKVNTKIFNSKEEADKAIQEKYEKVKSLVGKKQKEINDIYDAKYIDAVNKGTITKEQALQALKKAGREISDAYKQLSAPESSVVKKTAPVNSQDFIELMADLDLIDKDDITEGAKLILEKIESTYLNPKHPLYKKLTEEERLEVRNKYNDILGVPIIKKYDETDPEWRIKYNDAKNRVKKSLENPNLTEEEIIKIFNYELPDIFNQLKDTAVRAKYREFFKNERNKLIDTLKNNKNSTDLNFVKKSIIDIFSKYKSLGDIEDAMTLLLTTKISEELKEEAFKIFESELSKKFDSEISKIVESKDGIQTNEVANYFINSLKKFKENVENAIKIYEKQADDIAEKTEGLNLAVDVDKDYKNTIHRNIINQDYNYTYSPTIGQRIAINNLIRSGILLSKEGENLNNRAEASEAINLGVARIYTIGINKGMQVFKKSDKIDLLKKELTSYLLAAKEKEESKESIQERVDAILEKVKSGEYETVDLLKELNIPETAEIDDATFKLFQEFRKSVTLIQTETETLDTLTTLEKLKEKFILENSFPSLKDFITKDIVKNLSKSLIKEKDEKFIDITPFYNDLIEAIEKIRTSDSEKESKNIIRELLKKHVLPYKQDDASNMIRAYIGNILEIQASINEDLIPEDLTDEEIISILNGNKRTLNANQIEQVKAYERDLIEMYKNKFFSAPSYNQMGLEFNQEDLALPKGYGTRYLALRPKDKSDVRTIEDLASEYNIVGGKLNIQFALQKIIDSDFATDGEKELASVLLNVIDKDQTITIDDTIDASGEWDPATESIKLNLSSVAYTEENPSNPIETVLLHELLHSQIEKALQQTNGEYTKAIKSLYAAVKDNPDAKTFHAFKPGMEEDEYLREFVIEAFTNPSFQKLLATIPYAKSGKSSWQKFIDILANLLKSIGIDIEGTVLNEVINKTTELIKYDYTEKTLTKLHSVNTIEEINELEAEINKETTMLNPSIVESINSALESKRKSILANEINERAKKMTKVKLDGKTYYLNFTNNDIELYTKTNKKLVRVRKPEIIEALIQNKLKELGVIKFLGEDNFDAIKDLMGDPTEIGSYASGMMNETPLSESRLAKALDADVFLRFESIDDLKNFRKDYWAFVRERPDAKYRSIDALRDAYSGRGVNSYIDIVEGLGGLNLKNGVNLTDKKIDRLINNGILRINMKGAVHEDYVDDDENPVSIDDFVELYEMILNGVPIELSDRDIVKLKINKVLKDIFGVKSISNTTQDLIENAVRSVSDYDLEEDLEKEPPLTEEKPPETEFDSKEEDSKERKLPSQFIYSNDAEDDKNSITAKNRYGLRSYSFDVDRFKNENPSFKKYYYKIRNIINNLHLKPIEDLSKIFVTLINEDSETINLRWDGSDQDPNVINNPGVICYLSDENGNPYVFDVDGNIIDTLSKNDLKNDKGLKNGENQIVYFTTFRADNKTKVFAELEEESKQKLLAARKKVEEGTPQIANITRITAGQIKRNTLVTPSGKNQVSTKTDEDFYNQLQQKNVTLVFNKKGGLNVQLQDGKGAINTFGLYPPETGKVINKNTGVSLYDYLINILLVYNQTKARNEVTTDMDNALQTFVRNMWLTGDMYKLKILHNQGQIYIKGKNDEKFTILQIINKDGTINEKNNAIAKNFINNMPVNIYKNWLNESVPFKFPRVYTKEDGQKIIRFETLNYKDFLFKQIGLKSNDKDLPAEGEGYRYDSIIEFGDPRDIVEVVPPIITVTEKEMLDNNNIVEDKVEEAINNAPTDTNTVKNKERENILNNKRKFKAPLFNQILEKTC